MLYQTIDHLEFYVDDAPAAAAQYCSGYGFAMQGNPIGCDDDPSRESIVVRQGDIRLVFTSGRPGTAERAWVERHGDGVAVIAFGSPDARLAFAEAVNHGATPVREPLTGRIGDQKIIFGEVVGFADIIHRFVERPAGEATDDGAEWLLRTVDHLAVCLPSGELDATVEFYRSVFGFEQIFEEHIQVGDQAMESKVVQSPSTEITFTLIQPDTNRRAGQIDGFLKDHGGAGVQHAAFATGNIVDTVRRLEQQGVRFLSTPAGYYDAVTERVGKTDFPIDELRATNVLVDRDHWGELFQIFTESTHPRGTFFVEVIEREGARTFGSGNVKALYEAVERDRVSTPEPA